jgi:hypothetical protein
VKDESANILWNLNQHSNDNIMYLLQIQRNQNTEDEIMKRYQQRLERWSRQLYSSKRGIKEEQFEKEKKKNNKREKVFFFCVLTLS